VIAAFVATFQFMTRVRRRVARRRATDAKPAETRVEPEPTEARPAREAE
jgi:hypothetical protein